MENKYLLGEDTSWGGGRAMKVYFLNVGYGEAVVVRAGGATIVIDGGSGQDAVYLKPYTIRLTRFLEALGVTKIDLLLMTHIHEDHIGALPAVVEQFAIDEIWCGICPQGDIAGMLSRVREQAMLDHSSTLFYKALEAYDRVRALAEERGILLRAMPGGKQAQIGPLCVQTLGMSGTQMTRVQGRFEEMFAATDDKLLYSLFCENDYISNATSLVCRICEGQAAVLLTGDKVGGWDALRRQYEMRAQVLKITHHGQRDGMPLDMLEGAQPEVIVVCAEGSKGAHPADAGVLRRAMDYLADKGVRERVYVTGALRQGARDGNALVLVLNPETGEVMDDIETLS